MNPRRLVPHLPPAVGHGEGHRHGGPFTPAGLRLLAVPEDDDLEYNGFYSQQLSQHQSGPADWCRPAQFSQRSPAGTCEQYLDLETTWSSFMIG